MRKRKHTEEADRNQTRSFDQQEQFSIHHSASSIYIDEIDRETIDQAFRPLEPLIGVSQLDIKPGRDDDPESPS
jgi:hypothetical protein